MFDPLPASPFQGEEAFVSGAGVPISREAIVGEARSWLGTPYRHQASLKGVGCDCLGLIRGIWRAFYGDEPERAPHYSPDWAEARGAETLAEAAGRHLTPITIADADAADVLLFRWRSNLPAKHVAVLVAGDTFVHAQEGAAVTAASFTPWWRRRTAFAFRFPALAADAASAWRAHGGTLGPGEI